MQFDLFAARLDKLDRDQPAQSSVVLGLHDEMGERACHRIDYHPSKLPADPVTAEDLSSDAELRRLADQTL